MMILSVWIGLALLWLYTLFSYSDKSESLWVGLLFLWMLLGLHYIRSVRKWKKVDELRRKERLETMSNKKVNDET